MMRKLLEMIFPPKYIDYRIIWKDKLIPTYVFTGLVDITPLEIILQTIKVNNGKKNFIIEFMYNGEWKDINYHTKKLLNKSKKSKTFLNEILELLLLYFLIFIMSYLFNLL